MHNAYKFRIYPTEDQKIMFNKTFGCCRFLWNKILHDKINYYNENKEILYVKRSEYRTKYEFLKEVDSVAFSNIYFDMNFAFKNFYNNPNSGFPKFKIKKSKQTYTTYNNKKGESPATIRIENNTIRLPKIGFVKLRQHRNINGIIKSCTITKTSSEKYYISIKTDEDECKKSILNNNIIGIDLGIKHFAVMSNGEVIENPKWFSKNENKIARLQRNYSKKKKKSNNQNKARIKVAKCHEKITNQRNDFLHKLSSRIINDNQVIVIEDLIINNMTKYRNLNKSIYEVSWSKFGTMLKYKAERYGKNLIIADKEYPSSQLCNKCGYRNKQVKDLNLREWKCPECGEFHDRDYNAALNLVNYGINILNNRLIA